MDSPAEDAAHGTGALPPSHACAERCVLGLAAGEQFLLCAIRTWVQEVKAGDVFHLRVEDGFMAAGAPRGAGPFLALMAMIVRGAHRALEIRCPHAPGVSRDEECLLAFVISTSQGALSIDKLLADTLAPGANLSYLREAARDLVEALTIVQLAPLHGQAVHFSLSALSLYSTPPSLRLH